MRKLLDAIELMLKLITVVLGVFTIVEAVNAWQYKRKLARKAQDYLEDEFIPETNMGNTINVYSPMIKKNRKRVTTLLAATGIGCVAIVVLKIFKPERD